MPGGQRAGGVPEEYPEGFYGIGGLSGPERFRAPFQRALDAITSREARIDALRDRMPPSFAASESGQTRDYLAHAVGLLRFGANVQGFEFHPSVAVIAKDLRQLQMGLRDFREPLTRSVKQVMMPNIHEGFETSGASWDQSWEPLAPMTVKRRQDAYGLGPTPILVRRGRLKAAASSFSIWSINAVSAVVKDLPPNVWYGKLHQSGYGDYGSRDRTGKTSAPWFRPYKKKAMEVLASQYRRSPTEFSRHAVDEMAWKIFDAKIKQSGPGGRRGARSLVPRPFIQLREDAPPKIQQIFYDWMDEQIVRLGGWPKPTGG